MKIHQSILIRLIILLLKNKLLQILIHPAIFQFLYHLINRFFIGQYKLSHYILSISQIHWIHYFFIHLNIHYHFHKLIFLINIFHHYGNSLQIMNHRGRLIFHCHFFNYYFISLNNMFHLEIYINYYQKLHSNQNTPPNRIYTLIPILKFI